MAIAIDATANSGAADTSATLSDWTHTIGGADRVLLVGVSDSNYSSGAVDHVTSVTATKGGSDTAMTLIRKEPIGTYAYYSYWYIVAPDTGTCTIKVNASTTPFLSGVSISLTGVHQSTPIDVQASAFAITASPPASQNVTTNTDNARVMAFGVDTNGTIAAGSGTTRQAYNANTIEIGFFDVNANTSPAGSVTINVTRTGGAAEVAVFSVGWKDVSVSETPVNDAMIIIRKA